MTMIFQDNKLHILGNRYTSDRLEKEIQKIKDKNIKEICVDIKHYDGEANATFKQLIENRLMREGIKVIKWIG